uniref:Transposable element P transposase n=1 Tax=Bactrocera dorsalis TaxID=27457 RepID=A0A034VU60_BACDO
MKCVVKNCVNDRRNKNEKKTFFMFPNDKGQQKKWIQFCRNNQAFKPKTWRICMDHFNDEDIIGNGMYEMGLAAKRTLKPGAIPCRYNVAASENEQRATRAERRENKKIVTSLLINVDQPQEVREQCIPAEDFNVTKDCADISMENSFNELCTEDAAIKESSGQGDKIKMLEKKVKLLQTENKKLKDDFSHAKRKLEYEISELKVKLAKSEFYYKNVEEKLKEIFTDGQIKKLKNGSKRQIWTQTDIANSITLYSASAKGYRLLRRSNFPLPAVRTLQSWAQKVEIDRGILKRRTKTLRFKFRRSQATRSFLLRQSIRYCLTTC